MLLSLPVVITQPAVFGDLGGAGSVDHAYIWPDNDIRNSRIFLGVAEAKVCESLPRDDVLDLQVVPVPVQVVNRGCDVVLVFEEDKCNVVGLFPGQRCAV